MFVHDLIHNGRDEAVLFHGIQGKEPVTYRELREKIALYRNFFYAKGIRPGDSVGLISKNSAEFVYVYLAVTSLGAIIIPINFQLVVREIDYIVKDSSMKALVVMEKYALDIEQHIISEIETTIAASTYPPAPAEAKPNSEDDRCAIIYTSGTTGNPKGAVLSHKNLYTNAYAFYPILPIIPEDNFLCALPMYHCFAWTVSVLGALRFGTSITIVQTFTKEIVSIIRDYKVTLVAAVPSMYAYLENWGTAEDYKEVKYFVSGGAAMPVKGIEHLYRNYGKELLEGYGLSESSPIVSVNIPGKTKPGSVGPPILGVQVRVVDVNDVDVPLGEIGELLVSGPNVMLEYNNLPEETGKALRGGWLHTGDLASLDADGYIYIRDRLKDMILSSGENIYPREIEEVLYRYPGLAEAAVIGVRDLVRGQIVCAYIAMKEDAPFDLKALREYLQANLAPYKLPKKIIRLDSLPKNSTGKIVKTVLREMAHQEKKK